MDPNINAEKSVRDVTVIDMPARWIVVNIRLSTELSGDMRVSRSKDPLMMYASSMPMPNRMRGKTFYLNLITEARNIYM